MVERIPPAVRDGLRNDIDQLLGQAAGAVLDLGGSHSRSGYPPGIDLTVLRSAAYQPPRLPISGRFDTIVSVLQLGFVDRPGPLIARLVDRLADDGWLLFVEPALVPGYVERVATAANRLLPTALQQGPRPTVRRRLWMAQLTVTDVYRTTLATRVGPVRHVEVGRARHRIPPGSRPLS